MIRLEYDEIRRILFVYHSILNCSQTLVPKDPKDPKTNEVLPPKIKNIWPEYGERWENSPEVPRRSWNFLEFPAISVALLAQRFRLGGNRTDARG